MLTSYKEAKLRSLEPLVRVVSYAQCGGDPLLMGVVPIEAIQNCVNANELQ